MDLTGLGSVADAVNGIVNHFFPDKTQEEKDKASAELQQMMNTYNLTVSQIDVDKAEASSSDPLQHWRGALGWVCASAYAWHFILSPLFTYVMIFIYDYYGIKIPALPVLDMGSLSTLTMGMLGLGAMHTYQEVNNAK
jgi:hypothetical protein